MTAKLNSDNLKKKTKKNKPTNKQKTIQFKYDLVTAKIAGENVKLTNRLAK
jgi:hypothetical protein